MLRLCCSEQGGRPGGGGSHAVVLVCRQTNTEERRQPIRPALAQLSPPTGQSVTVSLIHTRAKRANGAQSLLDACGSLMCSEPSITLFQDPSKPRKNCQLVTVENRKRPEVGNTKPDVKVPSRKCGLPPCANPGP